MADPETGNPQDESLAASFVTYIDHREALDILSKYQKGFQVTLIKGFREDATAPTFRALIYKLKKEENDREYYEWQAEGISATPLGALKVAHKQAQQYLQDPSHR